MRNAIFFLCLFGATIGGCTHPVCPKDAIVRSRQPNVPLALRSDRPLAVIGDLQETLLWERLFLGRENNSRETGQLVCQLGSEMPVATVLLGDLVTWGASEASWQRFDALASRINGLLLPVRGNHDYFGDNVSANAAWLRHFPWSEHDPWYAITWNDLGLVFVNSNLDELTPTLQRAEQTWYVRALEQFRA